MPDRDLIAEGRRAIAALDQGSGPKAIASFEFQESVRGLLPIVLDELEQARKALDEIAERVRLDETGVWTDSDGLLESIGNTVESTGRKVWEEIDV